MTERYPGYPPDEPVIGATHYAPPQPGAAVHDGEYIGAGQASYDAAPEAEADQWADEYEDEYDYDADDPYGERGDDAPARQPVFYAVIALALILGVAFVVMLFTLFRNDDGGNTAVAAEFKVEIMQPLAGERVQTGKEFNILASASSNEPITRFELVINGQKVSEVAAAALDGTVYRGTMKWQFDRKGDYKLVVRVTSGSGATADSPEVKVGAVEPIGEKPVEIKGRVITTTNVRTGPGEEFESVAVLNNGQEVRILGRTRTNDWLLIDFEGGRWVKRAAIEAAESLDFLPIREVTPTPRPAATNTPVPSPSPSPKPSPGANAPDFVPTGALLIDGGTKLRVTVANLSPNNFSGGLEIAVGVMVQGQPKQTLSQAFSATIVANGSATFDFELQPVTQGGTAEVRIDPGNAVKEANEDNNSATIQISPPVEQPDILIAESKVEQGNVVIVIKNRGGALAASEVVVSVSLGGATTAQQQNIALAKNQTATFVLAKPPGQGAATITVTVNGTPLASGTMQIP